MIYFVFATTQKGVIGIDNKLPWRIPTELVNFQKITNYRTVLMGRRTYKSIGKPLPNRVNLILTRSRKKFLKSLTKQEQNYITIVTRVDQIIKKYSGNNNDDLYVIGGGEVFRQFQNNCDGAFISWIKKDWKGNTYFTFPNIDQYVAVPLFEEQEFTTKLYIKLG